MRRVRFMHFSIVYSGPLFGTNPTAPLSLGALNYRENLLQRFFL